MRSSTYGGMDHGLPGICRVLAMSVMALSMTQSGTSEMRAISQGSSGTHDRGESAQQRGVIEVEGHAKAWNGWSVGGDTTVQSGQALTITNTNANNVYGITSDRAQLAAGCRKPVTGGSVTSKLNNYFNASCFTTPPVIGDDGIGTGFGNSGVGMVNGPKQNNWDFALIKKTAIGLLGDAGNAEFRAEFFNMFNTPQFSNPDTAFSDATFGQITSTAVNPRFVQFALKLNF